MNPDTYKGVKMVYGDSGAVFWDSQAGYRRWGQIRFDGVNSETDYQCIPLLGGAPNWFKAPICFAVVDDFGNLVRVQ